MTRKVISKREQNMPCKYATYNMCRKSRIDISASSFLTFYIIFVGSKCSDNHEYRNCLDKMDIAIFLKYIANSFVLMHV